MNQTLKFILLIAGLLGSLVLSILYGGSESLTIDEGASGFILREIRLPKAFTALLAGASLSVAGLLLQVIFRNPLAGPYVLGISSGASLLVSVAIIAGGSVAGTVLTGRTLILVSSLTGSLCVTLLILSVAKKISSNVVLLLIGLMFSQACGALQSALEYFADPANLKNFVIWGMGSVSSTGSTDLLVFGPAVAVAIGASFSQAKPLNALLMGEEYARSAGIDAKKSRFVLLVIASALTGITTAYCGPVAFVGIAVPILSRLIFRTAAQQVHIVSCVIIGAGICLLADVISHRLINSGSLPFNMITTLTGAPVVIWLMFRNKNW